MGRDIAEACRRRCGCSSWQRCVRARPARLCFDADVEELVETEVQQPALVATSLAVLAALQARGIEPDYVVGHSVGEFAALAAASRSASRRRSASSVSAAWRWRRLRGAPRPMAAILGLDDDVVERICRRIRGVWPANYNCPGQLVVSGESEAVDECCAQAEEAGARRTVKLRVSGCVPLAARCARRRAAAAGRGQGRVSASPWHRSCRPSPRVWSRLPAIAPLLVDQLTAPVRFTQAATSSSAGAPARLSRSGPGTFCPGSSSASTRA